MIFFRSRWSGHGFALARCGVARHRQPSALCQWLRCHGHPREAEKATSQTLSGSSTTESCRRWCPITCTRNPSHEDGSRSSVATCRSSVDTVCYCLFDPFAFDPFASSSWLTLGCLVLATSTILPTPTCLQLWSVTRLACVDWQLCERKWGRSFLFPALCGLKRFPASFRSTCHAEPEIARVL